MRKLLVVFIILLMLGTAAFIIGWIQIFIPAGTYVVIHTKTRGFEPEVVSSGEFIWRAERLIPTNLTLYKFEIEPVEITGRIVNGTMPSGLIYGSVIDNETEFSYEIQVDIRIKLEPEALPRLVSEDDLTPENIEEWYQRKVELITGEITRLIHNSPQQMIREDFLSDLKANIAKMKVFEDIDIEQIVPVRFSFPDPDLYEETKRIYFSLLRAQEAIDIAAIQAEQSNFKVLKEYGELLSEYPLLIDYLYIQELKTKPSDIPELPVPNGE